MAANGTTDTPTNPNSEAAQKWEQPLNISDIKNEAKNWTLASDASMLLSLQNYSQKLVSRTHEVEKLLNTLIHETKMTNVRLDNTFNDFTMLANTQFVENRVYDEEVQTKEKKEEVVKKEPSREEVLVRVKTALNLGLSVLDTHFEKLKALGNSDSESDNDDDDDESSRDPYFLEAKDPYIHRTLPHLIASQSFFKDENVGLTTTYSDDETEKEGNDYGSLSESENSSSEDNEPPEDESEDELTRDKNDSFEPESEDNDTGGIFKAVKQNDYAKESESEDEKDEDEEEKEISNSRTIQKELSKVLVGSQSQITPEKKKKEKNKENKIKPTKKEPVNLFSDEPPPFEDDDSPFAPSKGLFSTKPGLFDNYDDDDEDNDNNISEIKTKTQTKNKIPKSSQLFDESDEEENDLFVNKTKKNTANQSALTNSSNSNLKKKVIISEDDDDDDDDGLFSDKKSIKSIPQKQQTKKTGLFDDEEDDEIFKPATASGKSQVGKQIVKNLFDDEDDDEEIGINTSVKKKKTGNAQSIKSDTAGKKTKDTETNLFNVSNDEDDDMFNKKTVNKTVSKSVINEKKDKIEQALSKPKRTAVKKTEPLNLFDDDEDDDLFAASKTKTVTTSQTVQKKKTSDAGLFEDDEDDLFSSKPSAIKNKSLEKKGLFLSDTEEEEAKSPEKPKEEFKKKIPVGGISVFGNADMLKAAQNKIGRNEEVVESSYKKEEDNSDIFTSKLDKNQQEKQEKSGDTKEEENEIENPLKEKDKKNMPVGGISVFGNSQLLNEAESKINKEEKKRKSDIKPKKDPLKGLFDEEDDDEDDDLFSGKQPVKPKKVEKTKLFSTDSDDDDILKSSEVVKSNKENVNKTTNDDKKLLEHSEESEVPKKTLNALTNTRDDKAEVNTKQPSPKIKKSKPKQKSLFDDDSDDDLFIPKPSSKSNTKLQSDLFDDSEEELFKPKMSKKSAQLFDSSADDDINTAETNRSIESKLLPPLPAKPEHKRTQEILEEPPPLPPRSPISSRSTTSDEERRKPAPRANKPAARKLPIQPMPVITVSSTDEDMPPPRPPRPDKFPTSKSSNTSQKTSENESEEVPPSVPERRSNSPVPPKVTPRKKKTKQSDNNTAKSDKTESTSGSSAESDPLSGIERKSPIPPVKPAKKPQMREKEKIINEPKADPFAAKQQNISKQLEALRGIKKPPLGAVSMFGPLNPAIIIPKRDPNPVEASSSSKENASPKLLGAENRDRIRVRPKDRRPPSRYIIMNDDSIKDVKGIHKEEKKEDISQTIISENLSKSDTEDDSDIFDEKSNKADTKKDVNLSLSNNKADIFKKSLEKSLSPPQPSKITKKESDDDEGDELFGTKVRNIPAVQVPKSKSKSINESQSKKREISEKPLKLDDSDDDIFKPKNSKTLTKKDSGDNLFEDLGKKNTKNLFESDDSDLDIFKRSPPKNVLAMDDDNEDDDDIFSSRA